MKSLKVHSYCDGHCGSLTSTCPIPLCQATWPCLFLYNFQSGWVNPKSNDPPWWWFQTHASAQHFPGCGTWFTHGSFIHKKLAVPLEYQQNRTASAFSYHQLLKTLQAPAWVLAHFPRALPQSASHSLLWEHLPAAAPFLSFGKCLHYSHRIKWVRIQRWWLSISMISLSNLGFVTIQYFWYF